MKHIIFTTAALITFLSFNGKAQDVDIYPSNLPDNTYFTKYDDNTKIISGINFLSLTDGTNSKMKTGSFTVKLYLLVPGTSEPIFVKTIDTDGQYHFSSREFKDLSVDLNDVAGLTKGTYRLGIYVDSNQDIKEPNEENNALLFEGEINYGSGKVIEKEPKTIVEIKKDVEDDEPESGE
jgi:hypothetical protein